MFQIASRHICASCRRQLLQQSRRQHQEPLRSISANGEQRRCINNSAVRRFEKPSPKAQQSKPTSSVSQEEVNHFNALASSWWDPHGPSRLLHLMNPLRHDFIRQCRSSQPASTTTLPYTPDTPAEQGQSYLDIGCGGGIFAESAARLHDTKQVIAIDPSSEVLAVAKEHARRDPLLQEPGRLTYVNTPIEELSRHLGGAEQRTQEQFDVVSLFEVIEHVPYPSSFVHEILPYVKPGGWLVGSTISRTWASWFTTKLVAEDIIGMVPRGTHDWNKYINPLEMKKFFAALDTAKHGKWSKVAIQEVAYIPGIGWKEVPSVEGVGNYFFGVKREE